MTNFTYWPYDEVTLEKEEINNILTIKTPWISATTKISFFNQDALNTLYTKFTSGTLSAPDLPLVSGFFRHFAHYPIAYILPFVKNNSPLDSHMLMDETLLKCDFLTLAKYILCNKESGLNEQDLTELFRVLPRTEWQWDKDAALEFALIGQKIHPECIFSVARRFHLLELLSSDKGNDMVRDLASLSESDYRDRVSKLIRQNHYITEQCQNALKPAEQLAQSAQPLVQKFREEERGHDKILAKALSHMDMTPEAIAVTVQTRALMAVLKFIAGRNFLAFTMAIDAFERNNYQEVDPLAQMLIKGGFHKAAEFANLHMKINDEGAHENVAQTLLEPMDLCPKDYAVEALMLMEFLSLIMSTISQSGQNNQSFHD